MAVAVDQSNLGHNSAGSGSSISLTTSGTVSAGGFIIIGVAWYGTQTLSSVTVGGSAGTVEKQGGGTTDANAHTAECWFQATSGLAASSTITATFSSGTTDPSISAMSFTGVATSSPVDTSSGPTNTPSTSWTSGAMTLAAGSVAVSVAMSTSFGSPTSTPGSGMTEATDFDDADGNGQTIAYHIDSGSGGSFTCSGTWSVNNGGVVNAVAYKSAAGGGGGTPAVMKLPALGVG